MYDLFISMYIYIYFLFICILFIENYTNYINIYIKRQM